MQNLSSCLKSSLDVVNINEIGGRNTREGGQMKIESFDGKKLI